MKFRDIFAHVLPALIVATPVVMILSRLGALLGHDTVSALKVRT